ncbi:arginyl-tRNA synthetase [Sphaeroforma arctica JP610]|uniref:Arginyl-tRNA synthetase n=1 Tax=Sphaeroforma arctica JP610 TaxID=667725 RepID=A0A0L0EYI5_9EUKA|nr:arginyl-tRNA synthetase [Sphaeroforma arctica JP610]KNC69542.1 arginyl-tRNA synthetase [Sphaeroforma arctica JP610]|eukprot:XP_014143444.1 arginyl-tRNA synthetase [Sphaeroforma arctica JP610]
MYYVVATQQDHHFKQLFQLLHRLGYDWANKCEHIAFGNCLLCCGHHLDYGMVKGMSTRKGDVVFLEQILDEARDRMMSRINDDPIRMSHMENPTMTVSTHNPRPK